MTDRSFTPHELHQKAISVVDQLDRLADAARDGGAPRAREIEVVTAAAAQLRRRIEDAAVGAAPDVGAAVDHLTAARLEIVRALDLVVELTECLPVAEPTGPAVGDRAGDGLPPRA